MVRPAVAEGYQNLATMLVLEAQQTGGHAPHTPSTYAPERHFFIPKTVQYLSAQG